MGVVLYTPVMPTPHPNEPSGRTAGPDAIWAPWRLEYLESIEDEDAGPGSTPTPPKAAAPADPPPPTPCFLETYWAHPELDREHHVILRDGHGMVLLNRYPYANGHLLVALGEGRPRLLDYTPGQRSALWSLVETATDLMERALDPQGVNIGINQGRAAGAGIPGHLHVHLVPRWGGDVNFISTIGQVRVIPGSLDVMAERYRRVLGRADQG